MSTAQSQQPDNVGRILSRLLSDEGAVRKFSNHSGISSVTLRAIKSSGVVNSYVTAVALERATDGMIMADHVTTVQTKGADLYRREPARTLLHMSFEQQISISRFLGRHGLTPGDLWNFMNAPAGKYERTKDLVRAVLIQLNINPEREESQ